MNIKETISYVAQRRYYIEKNKTNDVFCAGCLRATSPGETSECCGKEVISREEALRRIPIIIARLQEKLYGKTG